MPGLVKRGAAELSYRIYMADLAADSTPLVGEKYKSF